MLDMRRTTAEVCSNKLRFGRRRSRRPTYSRRQRYVALVWRVAASLSLCLAFNPQRPTCAAECHSLAYWSTPHGIGRAPVLLRAVRSAHNSQPPLRRTNQNFVHFYKMDAVPRDLHKSIGLAISGVFIRSHDMSILSRKVFP